MTWLSEIICLPLFSPFLNWDTQFSVTEIKMEYDHSRRLFIILYCITQRKAANTQNQIHYLGMFGIFAKWLLKSTAALTWYTWIRVMKVKWCKWCNIWMLAVPFCPLSKVSLPPTVKRRSCPHPPVKRRRAISGRMKTCSARWSAWKGFPPGTKRRLRGILLWWADKLSFLCCSLQHRCGGTGAAAAAGLPVKSRHYAVSSKCLLM